MTIVDFEPLTVAVPLWEDPPGVVRVGKSRVLLEIVLRAFKRGESPEAIVRSYKTLHLPDVYALISRYLENPAPFDQYLRQCEQEAQEVREKLDAAGMTGRVSRDELLARAKAWYCSRTTAGRFLGSRSSVLPAVCRWQGFSRSGATCRSGPPSTSCCLPPIAWRRRNAGTW